MRVMVLGAGGFIGSYIVPKLATEFEVIPVYKNEVDLFNVDNVKLLLEHVQPDVIINCISLGGKIGRAHV